LALSGAARTRLGPWPTDLKGAWTFPPGNVIHAPCRRGAPRRAGRMARRKPSVMILRHVAAFGGGVPGRFRLSARGGTRERFASTEDPSTVTRQSMRNGLRPPVPAHRPSARWAGALLRRGL
jgi:hypothetical protein